MKKILMWLTVLALLLTGAAFADQEDAPVLLVQLPEDAQMVENVAFDDGDFVQTYQLSGGAYVQLLRYARSDVTLDGIIAGDWPGATDVQSLDLRPSAAARRAERDAERCGGGRGSRARGAGARVGGSMRAGVSGGVSAAAGRRSNRRRGAAHGRFDGCARRFRRSGRRLKIKLKSRFFPKEKRFFPWKRAAGRSFGDSNPMAFMV